MALKSKNDCHISSKASLSQEKIRHCDETENRENFVIILVNERIAGNSSLI